MRAKGGGGKKNHTPQYQEGDQPRYRKKVRDLGKGNGLDITGRVRGGGHSTGSGICTSGREGDESQTRGATGSPSP